MADYRALSPLKPEPCTLCTPNPKTSILNSVLVGMESTGVEAEAGGRRSNFAGGLEGGGQGC